MGVKEGYLLTGVRFILDSGENILKLDSGDGCRTLLLLSLISRVRLCVTPWTAAYQAPPSMGFSRQEYWSGLPLPSPVYHPIFL